MVVLNPNNWHWVDKNTLPWTKEYLERTLTNLEVVSADGKHRIVLTKITDVTGDSNVSQRKGKPICYFDLQVSMAVGVLDGESSEELTAGVLSIPEFMHDESEFEQQYRDFKEFEPLVREQFYPRVRELLLQYQPTLIKEHLRDLQDS